MAVSYGRKPTQSRRNPSPIALLLPAEIAYDAVRVSTTSAVMPVRQPTPLRSTYTSLHALQSPQSTTSSSCPCSFERSKRRYATIAGENDQHHDSHSHDPKPQETEPHHQWPSPPKGHVHPTPYQIFGLRHNANYSKARYYELVKLYHPDKSPGPSATAPSVSTHVKMERYRLIVAANAILSDPVKRNAYDRIGAGWNGRAEVPGANARGGEKPGPFTQGFNGSASGTGGYDDPIWQNATWEDWERFYARRARETSGANPDQPPQGPLYMANSSFILLVALLALVGGSWNYTRAQDAGTYFVEQRDLVHDRAAKELRKVRQEMSGMRGREERIQWFLRNREATMGQMSGADVEQLREEKAQRVLPDAEVCNADGTVTRGKSE